MINKEEATKILKTALSLVKGDMNEAILESERLSLTRFAESKIHQNIDTESAALTMRIMKDKKISIVATGDLSEDGIKKAADDAAMILEYMPPDEQAVPLPQPDNALLQEDYMSPGSANFGPEQRAEAVRKIAAIGHKGNLEAAGAFRIETRTMAMANSFGLQRFFKGNSAEFSVTMSGRDKNSGWGIAYNPDALLIDVDQLGLMATRKAMLSRNPISLPDGQYTVILEPAAVGQLLLFLGFMGFGAKALAQRRSFMAGKIGQKIAGDNFTVYEDPFDPAFKAIPYDYEGTAKVKVPLIENGIARGVVSNSYYAAQIGETSTGNALHPANGSGPYPKYMVVTPGGKTLDEIIRGTEKGILITHFWYINFLNPMRTMITGTTRDGTFLIEDGKMTDPIVNMRTNQSILEAFSNIAEISRDQIVYPQYSVLMKVPAMKINNFNLTAEKVEGGEC
jgi:predicted Zn-dependent protease